MPEHRIEVSEQSIFSIHDYSDSTCWTGFSLGHGLDFHWTGLTKLL